MGHETGHCGEDTLPRRRDRSRVLAELLELGGNLVDEALPAEGFGGVAYCLDVRDRVYVRALCLRIILAMSGGWAW